MGTASRDGRPGQGKGRQGRNEQRGGEQRRSGHGRGEQARGEQARGEQRGERSKAAAGKRARKAGPGQRAGTGKAGRPAQQGGPGQHASSRKPHRKGAQPDIASGRVRLNNAKPARNQRVEAEGPGATYVSDGMRLQKVLAAAGVASRRGAEELIAAGRVEVDGQIVVEQGLRIDPSTAIIKVDGARVVIDESKQYLALNKPKGWQSTMSDEQGRPCIGDLVSERVMAGQRLFHVGRLDADTEGLILLTNDGELAHRLMHPSFEVPKTYLASVRGQVPRGLGRVLRQGVELDDGPAAVDEFAVLELNEGRSLVRLILHEGRKHIVRRLLAEVGFPVESLVRTDIGPITLGKQRPGSLRVLDSKEIGALYKAVGM
ncbi:putative pseudouridine synthase [Gordonia hirsuta DSM 44140 = NBRC 16056]|uniref:Pseudouridine synthase n=1 Tax=Gordonia hirsuta DSM 44140 = NBRC 16056 TaxID=1121927 RepID=L7L5K6_9ACTN|nr:pseudouridine synthase [Gordonia hirsuta]GAC56011.1 putative pseudouridine synthase [Gordonia hirsuta DSM 44140 = NBRC 16056]